MKRHSSLAPASKLLWDIYSYVYDGLLYFYPYQHLLDRVIAKLDNTAQERLILDLGCGTGNVTKKILSRFPLAKVEAVDWSAAMLKRARKKVSGPRAMFKREQLLDYLTKCPDNHYSDIVLVNVAYAIEDRTALWKGLYRCLRPGGCIVVANPDRAGNSNVIKEHLSVAPWFTLLRPRLFGIWIIDEAISLLGTSGKYNFISVSTLCAEVSEAGFEIHHDKTERCYGGSETGIDIIIVANKPYSVE